MLRRLVPALLVLPLAAACAHVEPPPGGAPDKTPPRLSLTVPESLSVVPNFRGPVVLRFDERISEQNVNDAISVSPRTSPVLIDRGRDALRVSLRSGWRPGTIYQVTVTPLIQDLFNNKVAQPVTLVFSTGPAIPATLLSGRVVSRVTGRPEADTRVEAVRQSDSLVYAVPTDTAGGFYIAHIPAGAYLLRAYRDINRNRALDSYEPRDSTRVEVTGQTSSPARLSVVDPDTTAPKLASIALASPGRLELKFDDYLDPAQTLTPGMVQIADTTGVFVPVATASLRRPEPPAPVAPPAAAARPPAAAPVPTPARPAPAPTETPLLPSQTLYVVLAQGAALTPGMKYHVSVRGVRNLVGLVGDARNDLTVPAPASGGNAPRR